MIYNNEKNCSNNILSYFLLIACIVLLILFFGLLITKKYICNSKMMPHYFDGNFNCSQKHVNNHTGRSFFLLFSFCKRQIIISNQ